MRKHLLALCSIFLLASGAMAQSGGDPFKWELGDNTSLKLGGFVRFCTSLDVEGSVAGNDFFTNTIPSETAYGDQSRLSFDPSATRFSLEFNQGTENLGNIKVYVESDFRAAGNSLRLRQAYIDMCGVTAGFAWSFMSDLAASAPTVDINGSPSRTFLRTTLVGYRRNLGDGLSVGISAEYPALNGIPAASAVNQNIPDVPLYVMHKSSNGHIKLAGVVTTMQYLKPLTIDERATNVGYGAQLSGSYKATSDLTLYGQAIYGQGIARYISAFASSPINLYALNNGDIATTPMGGASVGVSGKINKQLSASASYSFCNYDSNGDIDRIYGTNDYVSATLLYSPAKRLTLGAELLNGSNMDFDQAVGRATRVSLMVKYTL